MKDLGFGLWTHRGQNVTSGLRRVLLSGVSWLVGPRPDLLVGFPLSFLKPAEVCRRKPGCPGQCHTGKPERSPGQGAWGLAASGKPFIPVTFEPSVTLEQQRHGGWAPGKLLQRCRSPSRGLPSEHPVSRVQPLRKANSGAYLQSF